MPINSSIELRSKKELIERFIEQVNVSTKVDEDWRKFLHERKEADISAIIEEERLKPEETRRFIDNAFRDGMLKTTGTAIDKIMPPVSRFGGGQGSRKLHPLRLRCARRSRAALARDLALLCLRFAWQSQA